MDSVAEPLALSVEEGDGEADAEVVPDEDDVDVPEEEGVEVVEAEGEPVAEGVPLALDDSEDVRLGLADAVADLDWVLVRLPDGESDGL